MTICRAPDCTNKTIRHRTLCTKHKHRFRKNKTFDIPERIKKVEMLTNGTVKICKMHGELKYKDIYVQYSKYKDKKYKYYQCKECVSIKKQRLYRENVKKHNEFSAKTRMKYYEKVKLRENNYHIKKWMSLEDYRFMLLKQENKCAICKKEEISKHISGKIKRLSIDHCHESAKKGIIKIRGLLCTKCNTSLGLFSDSIELLESAIQYLKANQ